MPTLAPITVKRLDGTTNITYTDLVGASGDGSPAFWRQDIGQNLSLPQGMRPTLEVLTKNNGKKNARQTIVTIVRPFARYNVAGSFYEQVSKCVFSGIFTVPDNVPGDEAGEFIFQACNLLASDLMKLQAQSGYAAT